MQLCHSFEYKLCKGTFAFYSGHVFDDLCVCGRDNVFRNINIYFFDLYRYVYFVCLLLTQVFILVEFSMRRIDMH